MACVGFLCGGCLCCCGTCGAGCCFAGYKATKLALRVVRHVRARPPCEKGINCNCQEGQHLYYYSHPDDDDYGFSVRVHGGDGDFCTMRQCFNFMDPYQQGYVNEHAALREVLNHVSRKNPKVAADKRAVLRSDKKLRDLWKQIDSDGNGYISFPEWVEWVSSTGAAQFGFPTGVGILGEKGKAGAYCIPCTVEGCSCENFVYDEDNEKFCKCCGHRAGFHAADHVALVAASLPDDWRLVLSSHRALELAGQRQLVPLEPDGVAQVQEIMNASVKRAWSRDRGRTERVPDSYEVVRVERNENVRLWLKYLLKKTLIAEAINNPGSTTNNNMAPGPLELYTMLTSEKAGSLPLFERNPLDANLNEWFLWHGGSSDGIKNIADQEFKQLYAGKTTGTLYGAGTYLTDSCTKADEYAREDNATELYGLLLCRVMGGRVKYNDQVAPNAKYLMNSVLQGPFDSVFGDREKCRKTFKEIVIYESSQAYPEYIVYYRRKYASQDSAPTLSRRPSQETPTTSLATSLASRTSHS